METPSDNGLLLGGVPKRIARRMACIVENRFQLLRVEVQEERERLLLAIWLGLGASALGLLAGVALTILVAAAFWERSPVIALAVLTAVYSLAAAVFYGRLMRLRRDWQTLPETLGQLEKDRKCLGKILN